MTRSTKAERKARTVKCDTCGAAIGKCCVYTEGAFKGTTRFSGAHGGRFVAAEDAASSEKPDV